MSDRKLSSHSRWPCKRGLESSDCGFDPRFSRRRQRLEWLNIDVARRLGCLAVGESTERADRHKAVDLAHDQLREVGDRIAQVHGTQRREIGTVTGLEDRLLQ